MVGRSGRGFARMDPEKQREIARAGGRAAHASGHAHEWDSKQAAVAGRKGGLAAHHHKSAAFHHETAAHHHRQAATKYDAGHHDEADMHADAAGDHGRSARAHMDEALRHIEGEALGPANEATEGTVELPPASETAGGVASASERDEEYAARSHGEPESGNGAARKDQLNRQANGHN